MQPIHPAPKPIQRATQQVARTARSDASLKRSNADGPAKPPGLASWTPPEPLSAARTDELFARMAVLYPHAWTSQYVGDGGTTDDDALALAVAVWSDALAGLSEAQIRTGFRADHLRADHWPPSPSEFAAMCHGIPSLARVKHVLARVGPARSRFTRLVWSLLDTFAFTHADAKYADKLLAEAYELAKAHVMSGHPLPDEPSGAIEYQAVPRTPASPETAERCLREALEALETPTAPTTESESGHGG